jgi:hypothetical protein
MLYAALKRRSSTVLQAFVVVQTCVGMKKGARLESRALWDEAIAWLFLPQGRV